MSGLGIISGWGRECGDGNEGQQLYKKAEAGNITGRLWGNMYGEGSEVSEPTRGEGAVRSTRHLLLYWWVGGHVKPRFPVLLYPKSPGTLTLSRSGWHAALLSRIQGPSLLAPPFPHPVCSTAERVCLLFF